MSKLEKYISKSDVKLLKQLQKATLTNEITVACVGLYNHVKSTHTKCLDMFIVRSIIMINIDKVKMEVNLS